MAERKKPRRERARLLKDLRKELSGQSAGVQYVHALTDHVLKEKREARRQK